MSNSPHIVFLNRCYPPEVGATGKILKRLAEELSARFRVTLLVGRPALPSKDRSFWGWSVSSQEGAVTVERIGTTAFEHTCLIGRIINYLTYLLLAMVRVFTIRPTPAIIIAMTDPPLTCVIGALAVMIKSCKFVYSVQDLHPDMALASGMVKPGLVVSAWHWVHIWAMRKAHVVIVLGEDMRDRVVAKGINPERVVVIRHGADPRESPLSNGHPLVREIRNGFSFVVVYSGNFGFAGAWEVLIESARQLTGQDVRFVFVGEGSFQSKLKSLAVGLSNVLFLPYCSHEDFPYLLAAGDLHIVTIRTGLEGLVVPSKLYPLLVAGCPVLAIAPQGSDVARMIRQHQFGLFADSTSTDAVVESILYLKDHPCELKKMGQRAAKLGTVYSHSRMAGKFCNILEGFCS
ncbi:MAG: glycosyltransferase WbuB [Nitrospirales bacterium]|nr:MAG: glycosyltransferase WbuB [Nitrospirales bacterium]